MQLFLYYLYMTPDFLEVFLPILLTFSQIQNFLTLSFKTDGQQNQKLSLNLPSTQIFDL